MLSHAQGSGLDKLRQANDKDEFSLTLDVGLQPALEVDENIRRQADAIFEKEQEYVIEAANRKPKKDPTLYVNDDGFGNSLCDYHSYFIDMPPPN